MKTRDIEKIVDTILVGEIKGNKMMAFTLDDLVFKKLYKNEDNAEEETSKQDIYNFFFFKDDAEEAIKFLKM
ncbi:hypothetical protein PO908_02930 [Streptococcus anginosus]|uniref:hypothetical protein n=1 Tax=Streptococcus anginosus TaxID=1328 RepID=UPI002908186E|nr:hypothetical protein [Streptococcus anginosus]